MTVITEAWANYYLKLRGKVWVDQINATLTPGGNVWIDSRAEKGVGVAKATVKGTLDMVHISLPTKLFAWWRFSPARGSDGAPALGPDGQPSCLATMTAFADVDYNAQLMYGNLAVCLDTVLSKESCKQIADWSGQLETKKIFKFSPVTKSFGAGVCTPLPAPPPES